MKINLIGVPLFYGCDRKGVDLGPDYLRARNLSQVLKAHGHEVYDLGNIFVEKKEESDKYSYHSHMKYLDAIIDVNENLANAVYCSKEAGYFPLVLGGDHSLGLGSISGIAKHNNDFAVIWVDAHGDINTPETSPSGNVHGMPLGAAMGFGVSELTELCFKGIKVKPENVFIVGARDLDAGEVELIKNKNINAYSTEEVRSQGIESIMKDIYAKLNERNIKNVHLSFDIDCIDSKLVPGTGTPVENGMTIDEVKFLLRSLGESNLVKSMDFVELNAELDNTDDTLDLCMELLDHTFTYFK